MVKKKIDHFLYKNNKKEMRFFSFFRKGKKKFILFILSTIAFFFISLLLFPQFSLESNSFSDLLNPFPYHEHFSLSHRDIKQYTLPDTPISEISENETINATHYFSYPNNSRGIALCDNFESEIRCDELFEAMKSFNISLFSKKYLLIKMPTNKKKAIKSLHFAFVLSITLKRRLIVIGSPFKLPKIFTRIPKNLKNTTKIEKFKSSSFSHCDLNRFINVESKIIFLKGDDWDINDLLLSPYIWDLIPRPFNTHGMFLLTRLMNFTTNIFLPPDQLQISISLEFIPDEIALLKVIHHLAEGYSNWTIHIYSPNILFLNNFAKKLKKNFNIQINIIKELNKETVNILVQSDKFIGSLGFFASHVLNQIRGRGGIWLDPRNTMIVETSSSQSGALFLMGKKSANDLMCPGGVSAFQQFLLFNAM